MYSFLFLFFLDEQLTIVQMIMRSFYSDVMSLICDLFPLWDGKNLYRLLSRAEWVLLFGVRCT